MIDAHTRHERLDPLGDCSATQRQPIGHAHEAAGLDGAGKDMQGMNLIHEHVMEAA